MAFRPTKIVGRMRATSDGYVQALFDRCEDRCFVVDVAGLFVEDLLAVDADLEHAFVTCDERDGAELLAGLVQDHSLGSDGTLQVPAGDAVLDLDIDWHFGLLLP